MLEILNGMVTALADKPVLQSTVAALSTLVLEDPTTIGCGLLVAADKMPYAAAWIGLVIGIAGGDFLLYWSGRLARGYVPPRLTVESARFAKASRWLERNVVVAVLTARFIPGMRLPTYLGAGVLRVPPVKFLLSAVAATLAWTLVLLNLAVIAGESLFGYLGRWKLPAGVLLVALAVFIQWRWRHLKFRRWRNGEQERDRPMKSAFEFWPPVVFYFPVVLYCIWQALKHRGAMLLTVSNPSIYSGGMIMESKSSILSLVGPSQRRWVAPWTTFTVPAGPRSPLAMARQAEQAMTDAGITFPVVAKPDVGQRGFGVRPVDNRWQLADYLKECPDGIALILQHKVPYSEEAGVLYYRFPQYSQGRIISITIKHFPTVVGDGRSTLAQLIQSDRRTRVTQHIFLKRHRGRLEEVLPEGQMFQLVFAGDHSQGAVFRDGTHLATTAMRRRLDEITGSMPGFYYGRFDIRCRSIETLRQGHEFQIVEVNGAAGEPTHIWDPDARLVDAYRALFQQYRLLYEIGAVNRRRGFRPLPLPRLIGDVMAYRKRVRRYPLAY